MQLEMKITDMTAVFLRGIVMDRLVPLVRFLLATGIASAEVWPEQFEFLREEIPAASLCVRVNCGEEYRRLKGLGALAFVAREQDFRRGFPKEYPDLTVELLMKTTEDLDGLSFDGELLERVGALRVYGLHDVIQGDYRSFYKKLLDRFGPETDLRASNGSFCATAAAVEWIRAGGKACCAAFDEAGDTAFLEEVLAALNAIKKANFRLEGMPRLRAAYEQASQRQVINYKPVAGRDIFAFESGIHADGIFKNPINYEPFSPESVGGRRRLVIGKHSGHEAVQMKLYELGLPTDDELVARVNEAVRTRSIEACRSLGDDELRQIFRDLREGGSGA